MVLCRFRNIKVHGYEILYRNFARHTWSVLGPIIGAFYFESINNNDFLLQVEYKSQDAWVAMEANFFYFFLERLKVNYIEQK